MLDRIASSTNEYARMELIGMNSKESHSNRRPWKSVTRGDGLFFIAIHISMEAVKIGDKRDYFSKDNATLPVHHALNGISRERWEQIKRFFHIEDPRCEQRYHNGGNSNKSRFCHKV